MGFHSWDKMIGERESIVLACKACGIVGIPGALESVMSSKCPPWSLTDEGDIKTNRAHEAGGVERLRLALEIHESLIAIAEQEKLNAIPVVSIKFAAEGIRRFIQEREVSP